MFMERVRSPPPRTWLEALLAVFNPLLFYASLHALLLRPSLPARASFTAPRAPSATLLSTTPLASTAPTSRSYSHRHGARKHMCLQHLASSRSYSRSYSPLHRRQQQTRARHQNAPPPFRILVPF